MATPGSPRFAHFASIDWAKHKHHAVILNPAGQIVAAFDFEHSAAGGQPWREQAARYAPLAVAIETSQGTVIDPLLQTPDCTLYPLNPKAARALPGAQSAQRYQERSFRWLELCRRAALGLDTLEAALPARSAAGPTAAALPGRAGVD
jgi:Transposase